jgi:phospholipase/lecithinase/hemolysin
MPRNDIVLGSGGILPAIPFTDLVVFGDSMSDVGNVYRATNETHPGPWSFDGRFSDGRAWEEYLV